MYTNNYQFTEDICNRLNKLLYKFKLYGGNKKQA